MKTLRATRLFIRRFSVRRFYGGMIRRGDLCFDIGANTGDKTAIFLKLGARVVAVEPQQSCVSSLCERFAGNDRLTVVAKAVGARAGKGIMMISNESQLSTLSQEFIHAYAQPQFNWDQRQSVQLTTLDDLVAEYGEPAFVKIDVEGFEAQVFAGLSQTLGLISFEFNARLRHLACRCIETLERIGPAEYNIVAFENPDFELPTWVDAGRFTKIVNSLPESFLTGDIFVRF